MTLDSQKENPQATFMVLGMLFKYRCVAQSAYGGIRGALPKWFFLCLLLLQVWFWNARAETVTIILIPHIPRGAVIFSTNLHPDTTFCL